MLVFYCHPYSKSGMISPAKSAARANSYWE